MAVKISVRDDVSNLTDKIRPAAEAVQRGDIVIFPTETVYGIAARADMPEAIQKIYTAKKRVESRPFAYHIGNFEMMLRITGKLPENIFGILKKYLPGPYTFLLNINGMKTGIRFPKCAVAQTFLNECDYPVMATSANISGEPSPTNINMTIAVQESAAYVIDAGKTSEKGASTVIDLTTNPPTVVRQGSGKWGMKKLNIQ